MSTWRAGAQGFTGYLVAVVAVGCALGLRMLVEPLTGVGAPWVIFFTAVVVTTLAGGRGPGICATLLSAPLAAHVFVVPAGHSVSEAAAQAALFVADGLIVVYLGSLLTRRRREAQAAASAHARSEERLRLANEAAHIGTYDIDVTSDRAVGSPDLYAMFGIEAGAPIIERGLRAVHPDDAAIARAAYARSLDPAGDGHARLEARIVRPDGAVRWMSWVGRTYFDDTPRGRVAVRQVGAVVDITELKLAEAELRDAAREKDEFLAILSHELRNPLAAMRSAVHVLDRAPAGGPAARRAQQIIDRQVSQLTRLVEDLLDVTRIARGKLPLQRVRVELGELVQRTIDDLRGLAEAHGVALVVQPAPEPLWLDGDAARLVQVVGNLVHNAVKFTPDGGKVTVSLGREHGDALLRVRDTGAGIPAEDLERLFEPFVQLAPSFGRADGGLGLGLALVKGIVELHGGSVTAASAGPGRGSEFTIHLPLGPAVAPAAGAAALDTSSRRRVLVIEDNLDVAETLRDVLELMGHDVRIAFDGTAGIAAALEFHPDVVLCDLGLPGIDGYEVARRMRADQTLCGSTLVALSGFGQPEDRKRAADAGFTHHVTKPATIEVLQRALA